MATWRKWGLSLAAIVLLLGLVACGKGNSSSNDGGSNAAGKDQITVNIATGGSPRPFSYVNDNNEIDGYDIQIVKAIFEGLPQYKINIEKTEFPSIFAGLDSDRYQIGANNFASNAERKEKYIYSDPIFKNQFVIAVAESRDDIKTFADLEGKKTMVSPSVNYTVALENYNKDHAKTPVILNYSEAELVTVLQNVESGADDFNLIDAAMLQLYIKEYGLKLKAIPLSQEDSDRIGVPYSYLILSKGKNSEQLTKDVNERIKALIQDGTISKISEKYLNGDFAPDVQ
ncbi:transporter substrate-binding domain-containing protein [Paenibacillus motobuensis]|uniref:transporter substrate-binding domain-containing protein n=1 Tax=Paenibacillus TaxID=44249 RepID=UPI00203EBD12|nr:MULTISPECIES: transporter substrate-binding domain-containing protein [Paenibacillus]MCM3039970.1 transporter substrate-binding domain-containing protein [Paenibacillus lutimineralis]MCM3647074.1 transporter substrate-binding domain-containing protein [Paenibacillus motobuensis]